MPSWKPIKIAYDVTEPTSGLEEKLAPVIFLHGMTRSKEGWKVTNIDQPLADATHRRVYMLDARNHGDSEWSDDFDFDILSEDLKHFMETHKIPKAILIGHSMGGRTVMEFGKKYPEKVEKAIIEDMTPLSISGEINNQMRELLAAKSKCLDKIPVDADLEEAKTFVRDLFIGKAKELLKDYANERTKFEMGFDLKKTEEGFRWKTNYAVITKVVGEILGKEFDGKFEGDILFLCGPKSPFKVYDLKDRVLEKFPKAILKQVADATHMVHGEYPEEYVQLSAEFINGEA